MKLQKFILSEVNKNMSVYEIASIIIAVITLILDILNWRKK